MARLGDLLLPAVAGAAIGFVRDNDQKNAASRNTLSKQIGTWVEGGAVALGLVGGMGINLFGYSSEKLAELGAAFLSERLVRSQMSTGGFGTPAPYAVGGARAVGSMAYSRPMSSFQVKEPSMGLI